MLRLSLIHLVVGTQFITVPNCDGNYLRNSHRTFIKEATANFIFCNVLKLNEITY